MAYFRNRNYSITMVCIVWFGNCFIIKGLGLYRLLCVYEREMLLTAKTNDGFCWRENMFFVLD